MLTFGSYLTGGGLADIGAEAAGYRALFGVEYDPDRPTLSGRIADAAAVNLPDLRLIRAPVQSIDPADLPAVDWFHASPVCKEYSLAKSDGDADGGDDLAVAQAVARYISHHRPRAVTIENVVQYDGSVALGAILDALGGYGVTIVRVNMADYGVPQTRRRLIVYALRGGRAQVPDAQYHRNGAGSLILRSWISWYDALVDMIDDLPPSRLAPWQVARLPADLRDLLADSGPGILIDGIGGGARPVTVRPADAPAPSVMAATGGRVARAVLVQGMNTSKRAHWPQDRPAPTICTDRSALGARALLIPGANATGRDQYQYPDDSPAPTVASNKATGGARALLINGGSQVDDPIRVVKITPRALARWQTVPDSYVLPRRATVAGTLIGNGVPCLFMRIMGDQIRGALC